MEVLRAKMRDKTVDESWVEPPGPRAVPTSLPLQTEPSSLFPEHAWRPLAPPHRQLHRAYPSCNRSSQPANTSCPDVNLPHEPIFQTAELSSTERNGLQFLILKGAGGMSEAFTKSHLRREYRKLAKRFHPDHHQALGQEAAERASQEFLKLQEAKQSLARLFL